MVTGHPLPVPAADSEEGSQPQQDSQKLLLLRVEEAAARLGIGRTLMYQLVMQGVVESVPVGRLRRIPVECLNEYVARLRDASRSKRSVA